MFAYKFINIFRLFRHGKRLVLMVLTRLLTTLAYLYNLVGWLKM